MHVPPFVWRALSHSLRDGEVAEVTVAQAIDLLSTSGLESQYVQADGLVKIFKDCFEDGIGRVFLSLGNLITKMNLNIFRWKIAKEVKLIQIFVPLRSIVNLV